MTELIRIEDIEEFRLVRRIPRTEISPDILGGIRELDEKTQIEPMLRSILPDPTETAHGSTEIADILTTHVSYGGRARFAAFVNKGKSTRKVTSKRVGHQVYRLRQIPGLHLIILLAVGDIQDDITRDLVQVATDTETDYLIVDAVDVARLFIAYQHVCPLDGMPFMGGDCPTCGKSADEPLKLTIDVFEEPSWSYRSLKDVSTGVAKRYRAEIETDRHYSKAILREVIKVAVWGLRHSDYYRSALTEEIFGKQEADCVFLFVYLDRQHMWVCRARWISPTLPERLRPMEWRGQEQLGDIVIDWNEQHDTLQEAFERSTKQEWVRTVERVVPEFDRLVTAATSAFDERNAGRLSDDAFNEMMTKWEGTALELSQEAVSKTLPPVECTDANSAFKQLVNTAHNVFVPWASWGRVKREWPYKEWHLRTYLADHSMQRESFAHEWRKIL
jgi:hypothetical protein